MTKQTERDEALIAEAERLAREEIGQQLDYGGSPRDFVTTTQHHLIRLTRENWGPPAKPDRYVVAAREIFAGQEIKNSPTADEFRAGVHDNLPSLQAAAVLRRHFEPSAEVVEAARVIKRAYKFPDWSEAAQTLADFILKGDQ